MAQDLRRPSHREQALSTHQAPTDHEFSNVITRVRNRPLRQGRLWCWGRDHNNQLERRNSNRLPRSRPRSRGLLGDVFIDSARGRVGRPCSCLFCPNHETGWRVAHPAPVFSVPTMKLGAPSLTRTLRQGWVTTDARSPTSKNPVPHLPACTRQRLRELSRNLPLVGQASRCRHLQNRCFRYTRSSDLLYNCSASQVPGFLTRNFP